MLSGEMIQQLNAVLGYMKTPVVLRHRLDDSKAGGEIRQLTQTLADMSALITVEAGDSSEDAPIPSFSVETPEQPTGVRFAGVPLGHEFTSLILALLNAAGHPSRADAEHIEAARQLQGPLHFETFISLSCQNCPDVVQALNLISLVNPSVSHTMFDGGVFPELVKEREVMSVPSIFLNGELFAQGRLTLPEILNKLDSGAAARDRARLADKAPYDMLIVGGGACRGCSGHLCCAQGYSYRHSCRAFRRAGGRHTGYRELYLGQGNRRSGHGCGHGATRQGL